MKLVTTLIIACAVAMGSCASAKDIELRSPKGKVTISVGVTAEGRLSYSAKADGKLMLASSPLGITVDGVDLGNGASIVGKPVYTKINEKYKIFGNHPVALNNAREMTLMLETAGKKYGLVVRAYDDGVAVRYILPQGTTINGETTSWTLPETVGKVAWMDFDQAYEQFSHFTPVGQIPEDKPVMGPMTIQVGSYYLAISEADNRTFSDMSFIRHGNTLQATFPFQRNGWPIALDPSREPRVAQLAISKGQAVSPWRYTIIARNLTELVNSDMVTNLCPPPAAGSDFSWVQPGRCLWQWWSVGAPKLDDQKDWFDAAAKLKWEYYLIDDGWRGWNAPGKDNWTLLKEVIDYGKSVGVKSLVWVNSSEMRDAKSRRAYLEKVKAVGASGIKIDFIPDATSEIMNWYVGGMQDCAELKLMINYHGAVKPTGLRRTFPNELTREAVRGDEYHMTRYGRVMPHTQDVTLPFTRGLAGATDLTPMMIDPAQLITAHYTWPHEIAQAIVFLSPITHFADQYKFYVDNPDMDLFQELPTVWDETRVLDCTEIGSVVGYARRKGDTWWIGVMNGGAEQTVTIPLKFLKGSTYGTLLYDSPITDAAIDRTEKTVSPKDTLTIKLRPAGGFVARVGGRIPAIP